MSNELLPMGEVAQEVARVANVPLDVCPIWKMRRVVDELDSNLPRVLNYRMVPVAMIPRIVERLTAQGWFDREASSCN
jgi:hypothetical protein